MEMVRHRVYELDKCSERIEHVVPTYQAQEDQVSLLYIQATEQSCLALRHAAQRIRGNLRKGDTMLLLGRSCVVLLPGTPLTGAQAVARRVHSLVVNVEYELQILYGAAARTLLQRLQTDRAVVVGQDTDAITVTRQNDSSNESLEVDPLPYLAFLPNYPSHRLLHMFPFELADHYHCVPVGAERGVLTLATCQRLDAKALLHCREVTQRSIFQVRCEAMMIDEVLHYWQRLMAE